MKPVTFCLLAISDSDEDDISEQLAVTIVTLVLKSGKYLPWDCFKGRKIDSQLLGVIDLSDIISKMTTVLTQLQYVIGEI